MMPTLQLRRTSLFWFQGAWELGRVFGDELFCFCLFVCFSTPKVGDYFVFKSHKWVRFSCFCVWGCVCVCVCVCFVLFFLQNVQFPHHISKVRLIFFFFFLVSPVGKVFCFLLFLFVCFYLNLVFVFVSVLLPKVPPPLISNGALLSLFYYTDDGGHYVIDNFEFKCNSVKNLIPIWNFTNTFIQECKIIWEFQIRWGGTSLLRPLWRSWRYLKAYSLRSNRERFQNFLKIILFIYLFFCIFP